MEESYDGGKFYYSVLQCIMTFSFSLVLQMALRFEQQQSCSVPSLSCMDERLLTYSASVWHIHGKLPGLLREERWKRDRCFLYSPSIPQRTGLGFIQCKSRLQAEPGEWLLCTTAQSSRLSEIAGQRPGKHRLGSPGGLGISFPLILTKDGEREYLLLGKKSCIKYRITELGKDIWRSLVQLPAQCEANFQLAQTAQHLVWSTFADFPGWR